LLNGGILGLAFDDSGRADLTRARCGRRALGRRRALYFRATGAGARGAVAFGLVALRAIKNYRLGFGYRTLEYIIAQIRNRGAFRLKHILAQIRLCGARGYRRLEDIGAQVWLAARGAGRAYGARIRAATRRDFITCLALCNKGSGSIKPLFCL
jgi:hypothetical protein